MFNQNGTVRQVGVGISEGQRSETSSNINSLRHCLPGEMFAIEYADDQGRVIRTVAMKFGSSWYLPPNGEIWASSLRELKSDTWLAKELAQSVVAQHSEMPKKDAVDIMHASKR